MVARSSFELRCTYRSRSRPRLYLDLDHVFLFMICAACPSDWSMATRDNGTAYCLRFFEALQSASNAKLSCHKENSELVSFLTEKEYVQARDLFSQRASQRPVWISLNKRQGPFKWIRGKLNYTSWQPGEPARSSSSLCVTFTSTGWKPERCYTQHTTLCEREHYKADVSYRATLIMNETNSDPRRPNLAYRFVEIRGNCTVLHKVDEVATVSINPSPKPVIQLHILDRKVKNVTQKNVDFKESTIKFCLKVLDSLDEKYIMCFPVPTPAPTVTHKQCNESSSCCDMMGPFKVVKAPETPTITIRWSRPPNILLLGKRLQATCTGLVIADTGTLFWWKVTKGQKVRLTEGNNGVKISKRVHNGTSTTNITISGLKRNETGMRLECTVHNSYCPPQSSVCKMSEPIHIVVKKKTDRNFRPGRGKIQKYILLVALWFLVALVILIYASVRNSECSDVDRSDDSHLDEESSSEDSSMQDMTGSTAIDSSRTMESSVDSTPSPKSLPIKVKNKRT